MNKRFFSKLSLAVAVIGAVGALSPSQVNAEECWNYHTSEDCATHSKECTWTQAVAQCAGQPKACESDRARHNQKVCRSIHNCYWSDPGNFGFCTPRY